ncbi:hypothetical protein RJ640_001175 [Escallonia rubra]|uniref:NB-ARC domain-containing protein n=1 Tax=Escallonia rubra TaxID=112253 RepID=A0AA88QPX7_9ASTE|nr:hypothetical protein RJ640_001175 [Escallonia rubra]
MRSFGEAFLRHESKFIQKIVKVVGDKVKRTMLNVAPHLIGIDLRAGNIKSWLQDGSNDGKKEKIFNVDQGIVTIKEALCCRKVLVVLDDVDQVDQLDAVLGMRGWLYPGSKVIITTRQKQLLKASEVYKVHQVIGLDEIESFELFSWYAFGQDHPIEGYMGYTRRVVYYCNGLPLALQVLGSSLSRKSIDVLGSALEKLKAIPEGQIRRKLISYDSLQDDHDKNLFLDIACFFVGKDKDWTNMEREIVRQESTKEPGKRSRLWHKEAFNVLREKTNLVALDMSYSSLETVWKGNKLLTLLKMLDLSHSHGLVSDILDFYLVPNLERLVFKHRVNLIEVHESVGVLQRLNLLNLKGCQNLSQIMARNKTGKESRFFSPFICFFT